MMTEQLTKKLLIRLIKEEIEKTQLDEVGDRPPTRAPAAESSDARYERNLQNMLYRKLQKDLGGKDPAQHYGMFDLADKLADEREKFLKKQEKDRAATEKEREKKIQKQIKAQGGNPSSAWDRAEAEAAVKEKEIEFYTVPAGLSIGGTPLSKGKKVKYIEPGTQGQAQAIVVPDKGTKGGRSRSRGGGRGRQPRFMRGFEQYRIPFETEFGGLEKEDFDAFYDEMGVPNTRRDRDYRFGKKHAELFDQFLELERERLAGEQKARAKAAAAKTAAAKKPSQDKINAAIRFAVNSIISTNDLGQQLNWIDKGVNNIEKLHGRKLTPEERKGFRDDVIYNVSMMKQKAATA